jgi:hypothetical protein
MHVVEAKFRDPARAVWPPTEDVDDAADRAAAVDRRTATLDDLDSIDEDRGNLFDAVDTGEAGKQRCAVEEQLRVFLFQPEQQDLRRAAVLAVVLHPRARQQLDRVRQMARRRQTQFDIAEHLGANRRLAQTLRRARARNDQGGELLGQRRGARIGSESRRRESAVKHDGQAPSPSPVSIR